MAAVVRVKRRINEEPLNAFILNCKKRKINGDNDDNSIDTTTIRKNLLETKDEISTILKFAGTVESQDENIGSQITKLSKEDARQLALKSRKPNLSEKNRKDMRQNIHDNRFKVVNCFRTIQNDEESSNSSKSIPKEITVVDIEKHTDNVESSCNDNHQEKHLQQQQQQSTSASSSSSQPQFTMNDNIQENSNNYYVYDLYLPETNDQHQNFNVDYNDTTYLSVRPFDDLIYEERYNNDDDNPSMCGSEDSNAEDYWKNDYPDTEEDDSIDDLDMRKAVDEFDFEGERELSSDEEDYCEEYVHSIYSDANDYNDSSNRYGTAYAKYKARIMKQISDDDDDSDDIDDDCRDDSDD